MTNKQKNVHFSLEKPKHIPFNKFLWKFLEEDWSDDKKPVCPHKKHDDFAAIIEVSESKAHFSSKKPKHIPFNKFLREFLEEDWSDDKKPVCPHKKHDDFAAIIEASESKAHFSSQKPKHIPFNKFLREFLEEDWSK